MQHHTIPPIPTDQVEQDALIRWLLDHKLWTHKASVKVPDDINEMFEDIPGTEFMELKSDEDWPEREFDEGCLQECWDIGLVFVNPANETIEDDEALNTAFRVWIEAGPWHDMAEDDHTPEPEGGWNQYNRWIRSHDYRLNCGGKDLREAMLQLAQRVRFFYEDDGTGKGFWPCWWGENDVECVGEVGDPCPNCGFLVPEPEDAQESGD